jgi:hypothetical protein
VVVEATLPVTASAASAGAANLVLIDMVKFHPLRGRPVVARMPDWTEVLRIWFEMRRCDFGT